mgnify:CR=1 FL=1
MDYLEELLAQATPGPWETWDGSPTAKGVYSKIADLDICVMANPRSPAAPPHINASLIAMAPDLAKALIKAGEALNLHTTFEETPTDRGGYNGPKGRAWKAWIEAKTVALSEIKKLGDRE